MPRTAETRRKGRWVWPKITRAWRTPSSSSSSSSAGSGRNERTSLGGEPWQISASRSWASAAMSAIAATSSSPSADRANAAIAPVATGLSGASAGAAVQRSPLPRIQVAFSSSRSRATVSTGQPPNSA